MKERGIKIVVWVLIALAVILFVRFSYLWASRQFAGLEASGLHDTDAVTGATVVSGYSGGNAFPLKQGSAGSNVIKLQQFLNTYGGANLTVDGKFGPKTKAALAAYNGNTTVTQSQLTSWINSKVKNTSDNSGDWSGSSGSGDGYSTTPSGTDYFSDDEGNTDNANTNLAQYPANINDYAAELKTDLDSTKIFSTRDNSGVYAQALLLTKADLKKVADIFTTTYGQNLYSRIDNARFSVNTNVDLLIKNKLIACGAGPT